MHVCAVIRTILEITNSITRMVTCINHMGKYRQITVYILSSTGQAVDGGGLAKAKDRGHIDMTK